MIYIDTSVVLAELFLEDRHPPEAFWNEALFSSRLLQYETWTRVNARGATATYGSETHSLLDRITFIEMSARVTSSGRSTIPPWSETANESPGFTWPARAMRSERWSVTYSCTARIGEACQR